jgi:hypothetical protein
MKIRAADLETDYTLFSDEPLEGQRRRAGSKTPLPVVGPTHGASASARACSPPTGS